MLEILFSKPETNALRDVDRYLYAINFVYFQIFRFQPVYKIDSFLGLVCPRKLKGSKSWHCPID